VKSWLQDRYRERTTPEAVRPPSRSPGVAAGNAGINAMVMEARVERGEAHVAHGVPGASSTLSSTVLPALTTSPAESPQSISGMRSGALACARIVAPVNAFIGFGERDG